MYAKSMLIEDNAGGMWLICESRDRGYHYPQAVWGSRIADLVAIADADDLSDWTVEQLTDEDISSILAEIDRESRVIAEYDGRDIVIHVRTADGLQIGGSAARNCIGVSD